ncbi:hypothetical protein BJ085DRAFT_30637 [Dimargaris cristalligena]|uniref:DSBA-like thioredoxin domain-containing protein n=1 Tax=Dimargaris cristalligena TaxID=215637 RepID=A0A4P9ZYH9_9FUNG|nr:hypothetical protein BJ085DRAFT_30637 [Dimargaris cristalligena]|eukprot:RKP38121.1 hypothetical protein BJ085DRAFT_30637 [Dimargaris cristalligena]
MSAATPLQFWFEFNSTYSYLVAVYLSRTLSGQTGPGTLTLRQPLRVSFKPLRFGPVFQKFGGQATGPILSNPAKAAYMFRDLKREASYAAIPFRGYPAHPQPGPVNTGPVTQATALLVDCLEPQGNSQRLLAHWVASVYHAFFADQKDISQPEVVRALLEAFVPPAAPLLQTSVYLARLAPQAATTPVSALPALIYQLAVDHPEVRARVRANTEEAITRQMFGAPFLATADGELFWGHDRLQRAVQWGEDHPVKTANL